MSSENSLTLDDPNFLSFGKDSTPLPDDKILALSKMKAFADGTLNVTQNSMSVFHRVENIVGKEENAGYQHFLLFLLCFSQGL